MGARFGDDRRSLSTLERTDLASCSQGGHLFSSTEKDALTEELAQVRRMLALLAVSLKQLQLGPLPRDAQATSMSEEERFVAEMLRLGVLPKLTASGSLVGSADSKVNGDANAPWRDKDRSTSSALALGLDLSRLSPGAVALAMETHTQMDPLADAIVRHAALGASLTEAMAGLGLRDVATLCRFSLWRLLA